MGYISNELKEMFEKVCEEQGCKIAYPSSIEDSYYNEQTKTIYVGLTTCEELVMAVFFHELGHHFIEQRGLKFSLKIQEEITAWQLGLGSMYDYGYSLSDDITLVMLDYINSYSTHEYEELTKSELCKRQTKIRRLTNEICNE